VDRIAARADANKRMMYHYFGNKEELFRITLEQAYADFREAEANLKLDQHDPVTAVQVLVSFIFNYFLKNPEFITLVNSENLHKGRHLKASERSTEMSRQFLARTQHLLDRGVTAGVFRTGLDAVQVNISIAAVSYYYFTNRFTAAIVFERDMTSPKALAERLAFNTSTVLRMLCTANTIAELEKSGALT
jgi:AcrR family transcriptional regulator